MKAETIKKLQSLFEKYPEIKLVYLFGSQARGDAGPLSDYDFAAYIDEKDTIKRYNILFLLNGEISRILESDAVDTLSITDTQTPELKYDIINDGKIIFERDSYRVLVEPKILNEFFDFTYLLKKYNLTKA